MIKLTKLLTEAHYSRYWWLDPSCKFHSVPNQGHYPFAKDYLMTFYENNPIEYKKYKMAMSQDIYDGMYNLGWVRVGFVGYQGDYRMEFNYNPAKEPSSKQLYALKEKAIELGATELRNHSNGKRYNLEDW